MRWSKLSTIGYSYGVTQMQTINIKQEAHKLVDQLPDGATWEDVMYEAYVRQAVQEGIEAADRDEFASDEEVRRRFARWGVNIES
jgi:membrane protease subunit (stomatin/prohibitin family)